MYHIFIIRSYTRTLSKRLTKKDGGVVEGSGVDKYRQFTSDLLGLAEGCSRKTKDIIIYLTIYHKSATNFYVCWWKKNTEVVPICSTLMEMVRLCALKIRQFSNEFPQ